MILKAGLKEAAVLKKIAAPFNFQLSRGLAVKNLFLSNADCTDTGPTSICLMVVICFQIIK